MNMENSTWIKRSVISVAVASALISHTVIADESQNVDTTTIIGEASSFLDITIDQDELEKSQASSLKDIFKGQVDVTAGGSSIASQKVYVHGLESTMLNVTIDGATQTGSIFHHQGSISIEPELIKQVDVQAGAGSALNGPGALAGSLNFTTKDPDGLLDSDEKFGALIKGSYSTNANAYKTSATLYGKLNDNFSAMTSIVKSSADNYHDGDGNEIAYSADDQTNGLIKIVGNFNNNQRLSVSYDNRTNEAEILKRANWTYYTWNAAEDNETERVSTTIEYSINPDDNQWLALDTNVYYTENNINRVSGTDPADGQISSYGFDIRNKSQFSENAITYGIDYRNDTSFLTSSYADEGDVYGLYLQAQFKLSKDWLLHTGARYDSYDTTDADDQHFESSGLSPNLSVQFTPNDNLQLELGYAQAMRGVLVRESYLLYSGTDAVNAADLTEETSENIEFSVDYQLENLGLSAKVYHSTIDDVIDDASDSYENSGELVTQGVTLTANYRWETLQSSVSYNHNTNELNGEPLSDYETNLGTSTGDKINLTLDYQLSESLEFGWSANFVTRLTDVPSYMLEEAGYGIHDIYGQWLPLNDDSLKVTLSISNLFNKQYRDQDTFGTFVYPSGFELDGDMSQGRDFKLAVAWAL